MPTYPTTFVSRREMGHWTVEVFKVGNDEGETYEWRGRGVFFDQETAEDDGQGFESEEAAYEDAAYQINRDRDFIPS